MRKERGNLPALHRSRLGYGPNILTDFTDFPLCRLLKCQSFWDLHLHFLKFFVLHPPPFGMKAVQQGKSQSDYLCVRYDSEHGFRCHQNDGIRTSPIAGKSHRLSCATCFLFSPFIWPGVRRLVFSRGNHATARQPLSISSDAGDESI